MNVGEMQRKLSLWATQDKERTFYGLYDLLSNTDWLRLAHDVVKQNAGSMTAGCDGITMQAFDEHLEDHLQQLVQDLKAGTFEPAPVRRVYIRKANGKLRPLGIAPSATGSYKKRSVWCWNPSLKRILVNTLLDSAQPDAPWTPCAISNGA